jgi:glycosyltransferase involved in cell wall biosynthesis
MPLTVVEAMAMSRALVVSDIGDMPQWVNHNVNGWVSSNATQQEIDTILEIAWNKKEQWKEMGEKSFEIFCRKFPASPEECFLQQLSISG